MHPLYLLDAGREALTLLPIMSHVRTRFAPSPTGYLHIGGARTALFNWLFARKMGGTFILRIEDTDNARNTEEATRAIFTGMEWLGLDWDEGPMKGGDCGPYFQSQRNDIYDAYFKKLQDAGRVYEDEGAWRFRFDRSKPVTFHDLICGDITIDYRDASNTPDMAIRRADGSYIFHFVNVVDDIEMKMTHVIRGEDHIMNTPKHIQLFEAFGVTPPVFAHMPLILNQDGSKMSKRDVGAALGTYPEEGFLPEGVMNFLALLGWSPRGELAEQEVFSLEELVAAFDLAGVSKSPAIFDIEKLTHFNALYLRAMEPADFARAAEPYIRQSVKDPALDAAEIAGLLQARCERLTDIPEKVDFFDALPDYDGALFTNKKSKTDPEVARAMLEAAIPALEGLDGWTTEGIHDALIALAEKLAVKNATLMWPVRIAAAGKLVTPGGAVEICRILGKDETLRRLNAGLAMLGA